MIREGSHRHGDKVRVLLVGGVGRSGSTVLGRALACLPGVTSVGEVVHLWERGLLDNQRCGCNQPFSTCDFWSRVGSRAYGGWAQLNGESTFALKATVDRTRFLPWLIAGHGPRGYDARLSEYVGQLTRLYNAIQAVSRADVVVDTSKHASHAWLLRLVPNVDLRVVQLVRDSCGVAYSMSKQVRRPEISDRVEYMQSSSAAAASAQWATTNGLFDMIASTSTPLMRVRYEDFVDRTPKVMHAIGRFAGVEVPPEQLKMFQTGDLHLPPQHEVSGNPMRFSTGTVNLSRDEAWKSHLSTRDKVLVTTLTAIHRRKYGY